MYETSTVEDLCLLLPLLERKRKDSLNFVFKDLIQKRFLAIDDWKEIGKFRLQN